MSYTRALMAGVVVSSLCVIGAGAASAQSTYTDKPAPKSQTMERQRSTGSGLSTGTDHMVGRHSMEGEITSLDPKNGWVHVKTSDGTMIMQVPPASLQGMKKGDTVTVDLAMMKSGEKAK